MAARADALLADHERALGQRASRLARQATGERLEWTGGLLEYVDPARADDARALKRMAVRIRTRE